MSSTISSSTIRDVAAQRLATEFSKIIRQWLSPNEIDALLRLNSDEPRSLHEHEFCDSQLAMETAWQIITGLKCTPVEEQQIEEQEIELAAWSLAKRSDYSVGVKVSDTSAPSSRKAAAVVAIANIRKAYPEFHEWQTGQGCLALRYSGVGDCYLLLTEHVDSLEPTCDAVKFDVGLYAANRDLIDTSSALSDAMLPERINAMIQRMANPQSVADYFVVKLGEPPDIDDLQQLPINTGCGLECVKAIDAAAGLLAHVRAGFGGHDRLVVDTVGIVRRVVSVYWRG